VLVVSGLSADTGEMLKRAQSHYSFYNNVNVDITINANTSSDAARVVPAARHEGTPESKNGELISCPDKDALT
jgi:hypothetical protein